MTCDDETLEIWSKGGGVIRYDAITGKIVNQEILPIDGFLNQVYKHNEHYLMLYNNSNIALYEDGKVLVNAKLSGPISYAEWSESDQGWHIAGWREIVFIASDNQKRIPLQEIAVFIDAENGLYLCNDGKWNIVELKRINWIILQSFRYPHRPQDLRLAWIAINTPGPQSLQNSALRCNLPSSSIEYLFHFAAVLGPSPIIHRLLHRYHHHRLAHLLQFHPVLLEQLVLRLQHEDLRGACGYILVQPS